MYKRFELNRLGEGEEQFFLLQKDLVKKLFRGILRHKISIVVSVNGILGYLMTFLVGVYTKNVA